VRALDPWPAALKWAGRDPANYGVGIIRSCLVTDDVEREFASIRVAERRRMALYERFRAESGGHGGVPGITQEQRIPQGWIVGTLDECVAKTAAFIREYGLTDIVTWAVPPGLRPDQMNRHLERYAAELVPRLKQLFSS